MPGRHTHKWAQLRNFRNPYFRKLLLIFEPFSLLKGQTVEFSTVNWRKTAGHNLFPNCWENWITICYRDTQCNFAPSSDTAQRVPWSGPLAIWIVIRYPVMLYSVHFSDSVYQPSAFRTVETWGNDLLGKVPKPGIWGGKPPRHPLGGICPPAPCRLPDLPGCRSDLEPRVFFYCTLLHDLRNALVNKNWTL